jgi:RNA polymerase sigma-70 factor (ECF subfamily)
MGAVNSKTTLEVIRAAQQGCQESLSGLTEEAKRRVFTLLFRMTLDFHLAEDLTQDVIVGLVQSLKELDIRSVKSFWAWVYRTAIGKMQHHYRIQGKKRIEHKTSLDTEFLNNVIEGHEEGPARRLLKKESFESVWAAMDNLKTEYRSVLILRCIDGLPYARIAQILGGSQIRVRMLHQRAKGALRKQLARHGLSKSDFAEALALFAMVTAVSANKVSATTLTAAKSFNTVLKIVSKQGSVFRVTAAVIIGSIFTAVVILNTSLFEPHFDVVSFPIFDNSLGFQVYDSPTSGFVSQGPYISAYNPDGDGWICFNISNPAGPAVSIDSPESKPESHMLVLPNKAYIEYPLPENLIDTTGIDVAVMLFVWRKLPQILFIDVAGKQFELNPETYTGRYPPGFIIFGFDITDVKKPLKAVRITSLDNAGPHGGCGVGSLRIYTGENREP